uniref:AGC-kinase C-terminal domain-containing protein n=2 Tax=Macrostomum lignano TaxID=282301 RepID=A0A1I8IB07_9PLAT
MQYRQQQQQQQFQQYRPINAPAAPAPPPRTARRSSLIGSNNVNLASAALSSSGGGGGGGVGGAVQPVFYSPTLSTPGGIGDTGTMIVRCSSLGALNTSTSSSAEAAAVADSSRRRPRLVEQQQQQQALAGATGGGSDVASLTDTDSQVGGDDLGPLESPGSPPPMSTTPLTQPLQQQHEASLHQLPQSQQQHQQRSASTIRHVPAAACKFYLEHHFENLMKHHHERIKRRQKLEEEMNKAHPFFCTPDPVNWDTLLHSIAPYVPLIRDELDTSNFDPVEEDARGADSDGDDTSEQLAQDGINPHEKFPDFTYRRFFDSIY